jgi:hydrogenase maturation protein HypF
MLPASPLHHLLARCFGGPLVATSGNPSGEPLCIDTAEAVERLGAEGPTPVADAFLVHDRPIARPLDDSVAQVIEGRPVLLRRARGFAPEPLRPADVAAPGLAAGPEDGAVVALGGDLKSAPALARGGRIWLAPHLGDLARPRVLERLRRGLAEITAGRGGALAALACDGHPGYLSHQLVEGDARAVPVPHHLAHGLAVMAEHGLAPPLTLIALDGLGLGPGPGHRLWGGEVLRIDADGWRRPAGLRPFPLPGGERAMGEPRRAALGLLAAAWAAEAAFAHPGSRHSRDAFSPAERDLLLRAVAGGCNAPLCSSAGRLFDAAASLLGLVQVLSHEGEGGLRLEGLAAAGQTAGTDGGAYPLPLCAPDGNDGVAWLDWQPLLTALLEDIAAGIPAAFCAARFHRGLAEGFATAAAAAVGPEGPRWVALGGGCFQNRLLLEETLAALRRRRLDPFWNEQVPCNDGGLALGQVWGASHPALLRFRPLSGREPVPITEEETHRRGATAHVSGRRRSHPRDRGSVARRGG